jgi:hypothetical protein
VSGAVTPDRIPVIAGIDEIKDRPEDPAPMAPMAYAVRMTI